MRSTLGNKNRSLDIKKDALDDKNSIKFDKAKKQYVENMLKISQKMVEKWNESNEEALGHKENENKVKKRAKELSLIEFYNKLMEETQKEKEKFIRNTKGTFFKQSNEPKEYESARLCVETPKEQEAQRIFDEDLKVKEKELHLDCSMFVNNIVEEKKKEEPKKQQPKIKKNTAKSSLVKNQFENRRYSKIEEKKKQKITREKKEMDVTKRENEKLHKNSLKFKKYECERCKGHTKSSLHEMNGRKTEERDLNYKDNEFTEIQQNTRSKIREMSIKRDLEIASEKSKVRDAVKKIIMEEQKKAMIEERRVQKEKEEFEKRESKRLQKEMKKMKKNQPERIKYYQDWLEQQQKSNEIQESIQRSEVNNSLENVDCNKKLNEKIITEHLKKNVEDKIFHLLQRIKQEEKKNDDRYDFSTTDDEQSFDYDNHHLSGCKVKEKPKCPLHKAKNDYKSRYMHSEQKMLNKNCIQFNPYLHEENY